MNDSSNHPPHLQSRRTFIARLAAVAAVLSRPSEVWGSLQTHVPGLGAIAASVAKWSPKIGPLMTRWSSLVDPKLPHPEYPRPQLVRKDWLNLNGVWEYQPGASATEPPPFGRALSSSILVPYPVESALSGVMEHHDRLWYRRTLSIPKTWHDKHVMLHFGAVDYESEVFVNGKSVGVHRGGYDPFSYDLTAHLRRGADNELIVRVFDPTQAGGQPRGKQNTQPRGITYTPTTGIWQTVWLEPLPANHIAGLTMTPDVDAGVLRLTIAASSASDSANIRLKVKQGSNVISTFSATPNKEIAIPIPSARLWSPDDPFLYSLELSLGSGKDSDRVSSYFGMRKSHIGDVDGQKKLMLNNKFEFQLGPLDQGFWPDGIYTAPTDEALKDDIVQLKAMGFNMVRKHIKVEPARWYYWADKLGILVWQDMPSANSYPGKAFTPPPVEKEEFAAELKRMIETHRNVPSIVLWTVFNEGQGQFDTGRLVDIVRSLDPSRPVNEASGGEIMGFGNLNDVHSYPEPAVRPSNGRQAMVCGEFGGIGYLIPEHSWSKAGRGYVDVYTPTDLLYLYAEYIAQVKVLRDSKNLSAAVYTELTDVMTEVNGLLTYDRIAKIAVEKIRQVNLFQFPAPTYRAVMPTSEKQRQEWKYTLQRPPESWWSKGFDDARWPTGLGGFGDKAGDPGTKWNTPDLWLRRHFNPGVLKSGDLQNLVLTEIHGGVVEIYINGEKVDSQRGNNRAGELHYEHRPLSPAVRAAVLANADNVIAVHCHNSGVQQPAFDAGLSVRVP